MVHEAVSALIALIPPTEDSAGDRFDWDQIAERTGWRYPSDYRQFLEAYGAGGLFCGARHTTDFGHKVYFKGGCPELHQVTVYSPAPAGSVGVAEPFVSRWPASGLKSWGDGGHCLSFEWRCTDPDPEQWTVAVSSLDEESPQARIVDELDMGMAETLLAVLTGRLDLSRHGLVLPGPGALVFEGWRAHELKLREEYPDYRTWS